MLIGVLGPIVFQVNADKVLTWRELRRSKEARWATHDVATRAPLLEFIGPGLARLDLSVHLNIGLGIDPKQTIAEMYAQLDAGNVLQFTVAGELIGDFVIKAISDQWKRFGRQQHTAVLMVADVDLSLEEYRS